MRAHVTHDRILRVAFALTEGAGMGEREAAWDGAAAAAVAAFAGGAGLVAFATIGDPNVYSTFTYLAATVRPQVPGLTVATVPGITAMQDLAARSGIVLCEGRETLALLPLTAGLVPFKEALARFDTVVGYKSGSHLPEVLPQPPHPPHMNRRAGPRSGSWGPGRGRRTCSRCARLR